MKASQAIRANFSDDKKLIESVSNFVKDDVLADKFIPDHLCSDIYILLDDLKNNLSPLKYSVALTNIDLLKMELGTLSQFDRDLNYQYYMLRQELEDLCDDSRIEEKELSAGMIKYTLNNFRDSLKGVLDSVRATRKSVLEMM